VVRRLHSDGSLLLILSRRGHDSHTNKRKNMT
jgi:hypothetical protein